MCDMCLAGEPGVRCCVLVVKTCASCFFGNGQDVPSRAEHPSSGPIRRRQYPSLPKHQCFIRAFHIFACVICHHNAMCHLVLSRTASQCCMSHVAHADFFFFSLSFSPFSTMSAMAYFTAQRPSFFQAALSSGTPSASTNRRCAWQHCEPQSDKAFSSSRRSHEILRVRTWRGSTAPNHRRVRAGCVLP
jgi:hypothetical protein